MFFFYLSFVFSFIFFILFFFCLFSFFLFFQKKLFFSKKLLPFYFENYLSFSFLLPIQDDALKITVGCRSCTWPSIHLFKARTLEITVGYRSWTGPKISREKKTCTHVVDPLVRTAKNIGGLWARPPSETFFVSHCLGAWDGQDVETRAWAGDTGQPTRETTERDAEM